MSEIKDGGPAFPVSTRETDLEACGSYGHQDGMHTWQFGGMTLRDYFAAKAMQGWLCSYGPDMLHPVRNECAADVARDAYATADAMLKAREAS